MSKELQQQILKAEGQLQEDFAGIFQREANLHNEINNNFNQEVEKQVSNFNNLVKAEKKDSSKRMEKIQVDRDKGEEEKLLNQMNNI